MKNIEEEFKNNFCNYGSHFIIWKPETSPQKVLEWLKAIQVQALVSPTEPTFTQKQILDLVRKELTEAFSDDYTPDELKDKIYLVHGYIIGALRR